MTYQEIMTHYRQIAQLESIKSVLSWDLEVYLPKLSFTVRHEQMLALTGEIQKLYADEKFIDSLLESKDSNHQVRNLKRIVFRRIAVPAQLYQKIQKAELEAVEKWKHAKANHDFSAVSPLIRELIELRRESAHYVSNFPQLREQFQDTLPYGVMLETNEPGLRLDQVQKLFGGLQAGLTELVKNLDLNGNAVRTFTYPKATFSFNNLIEKFGFDINKGRLDITSAHPFCSGYLGDVRITTRNTADFCDDLLTTMHEMGHGIYEQNLPADLQWTPSGNAASTSFHESQSRFFENQIGRSEGFISYLSKETQISRDSLRQHILMLSKNPIRTSADELHYNLHVILRFNLEKALVAGELQVQDLPDAWNEGMQSLLGIKINNDSEGCLQDVHWFCADFGYFPTYTLGNMIAAQLFYDFQIQHPDWSERLEKGDFIFVKEYLAKVHTLGAQHDFAGTIKQVFNGAELSEQFLLKYLKQKYFAA